MSDEQSEGSSPADGSEELDAVTSLVRRLVVAAKTGPHGPGTRRGGHRQANCDSCHAISEGYSFVAAMANNSDVLATGDEKIGQPQPRLVIVP